MSLQLQRAITVRHRTVAQHTACITAQHSIEIPMNGFDVTGEQMLLNVKDIQKKRVWHGGEPKGSIFLMEA